MSRLFPVCVSRTEAGALMFKQGHDPTPVPGDKGGHVTLNVTVGGSRTSLQFCRRCGLAFVARQETVFDKASPDATMSEGGNA